MRMMKMTGAVAVFMSIASGVVLAQSGARPLAVTVDQPAIDPVAVPGIDNASPVVTKPTNANPEAGADTPVAQEFHAAGFAGPTTGNVAKKSPRAKRAPNRITVESGVNRTYGIAMNHINRLATPFTRARVVTTSNAGIESVGGVLYVSTNSTEEIGLFIHEADDPSHVISLTLEPGSMAPVSTDINIEGLSRSVKPQPHLKRDGEVAQRFETSQSYVETITTVMNQLALGRLPEGHGLSEFNPRLHGLMADCQIPGFSVTPMQVVDGDELITIVYRATAITTATVNERSCNRTARAVAAWPKRTLLPGESTEIYAVYARPDESDAEQLRPRVIGGEL